MKIKYTTISKTGRRSNNEDCFNVLEMPEYNRFMGIVCDGMGGHSFGEVASEVVCDAISKYWQDNTDTPDSDQKVVMACKKACNAINQKSYDLSHAEMGTTMVMASIEGDKATIAHVGDTVATCKGKVRDYFTEPKIMCVSTLDGKWCHAVSSATVQKSLFPTLGSSPFRKETGYYSVLMACTRAWHPTSYKQGCWTTSPWKIYSMYLTLSVKNKVMITIRQY